MAETRRGQEDMAHPSAEKKTPCPITREQFRENAKPVLASFGDNQIVCAVKEFKGASGYPDGTGSIGWYGNDKGVMVIDGVPCKITIQTTVVIVNSKEVR